MHSRVVYGLLHQPLIHEAWDALVASKQAEYTGRRPQFSWHPSKTGRAQGFLEKENAGQLQDLLEFFSGDDGEAQWIVSLAYDLADIVLTSGPAPSPQFSSGSTTNGTSAASAANVSPPQPCHSQDSPAALPTLPTQPSQQPMLSSSPNSQNSSYASQFRTAMFVPSQQFAPTSRTSPESASHSPMTASQSSLDQRELPQLPSSNGPAGADSLMDFEYTTAPVAFEDWESLAGAVVNDASSEQVAGGTQGGWGVMQYFGDPRVTS